MRQWVRPVGGLALLCLSCSGGCATVTRAATVHLPPGIRTATGIARAVRGTGVEVFVVRVEASPAEMHEALVAAGGQRDTTSAESQAGLEVITLDASVFEPTLRAMHPVNAPELTWLGMPVQWSTVLRWPQGSIDVRAWILSLEDGEAAAVDLHVAINPPLRRERLLLPGKVMVLVPGGEIFPLAWDQAVRPGPLAQGMAGDVPVLVAFRPRFADARAR